jgi:hypothetical protein
MEIGFAGVSRLWLVGVCAMATLVAAAPAEAARMMIVSGSGVWGANAPATAYSAVGQSFSFFFQMPINYTFTDYGVVKVVDPTEIRNLRLSLGGAPIPVSISASPPPSCAAVTGLLCAVEMVTPAGGAGLTLDFGDSSVDLFSMNNIDMGSGGVLKRGAFGFAPNSNGFPSAIDGQINEGGGMMSMVPEPAAWTIMLVGLGSVGGALRSSRREPAPGLNRRVGA